MKLLISGMPGSGKTTLCERVIEELEGMLKIGGFISSEIREGGIRKGFKIRDVRTGKWGTLAHIDQMTGPRLGKYRVNLNDLNTIGVGAILEALEDCDLIIIDEIGPMELFSDEFEKVIKDTFDSKKHVIATIHFRSRDRLIRRFGMGDIPFLMIDEGNRESLVKDIVGKLKEEWGGS
ncbi:MAG: NTPase [Candidatus Hydrothermarchaeales archaeon]